MVYTVQKSSMSRAIPSNMMEGKITFAQYATQKIKFQVVTIIMYTVQLFIKKEKVKVTYTTYMIV